MQSAPVGIIGGGLSGLYAAYLLEQQGIRNSLLLEARQLLGGRILSLPAAAATRQRFDLGPSWFWPELQPRLDHLIDELGLESYPQYESGDCVVERSWQEAPIRLPGYVSAPTSMRLRGGMAALLDALRERLSGTQIITAQRVYRLCHRGSDIEVFSSTNAGTRQQSWRFQQVLLALPPRLAGQLEFSPPLPPSLRASWQATDTWMAAQSKYVAVYERPFWRQLGLSGEGRSVRGPLGEIHDASLPGGQAALMGFLGLPADARRSLGESELRRHCRAQLQRMFGAAAASPREEFLKDWAADACTATAADLDSRGLHGFAPSAWALSGPWQGRLAGIASEWASQFPGYIAGALEATHGGLQALNLQA